MQAIALIPADPIVDHPVLQGIHAEYLAWVHAEMARLADPPDERAARPAALAAALLREAGAYRPPRGSLYLIEVGGALVGTCGLRCLDAGVGEVKRLYVRPSHRGRGLGHLALCRLLSDAVAFGHRTVHLDSAPFMAAAHRLYEAHGFVDCGPYAGTEVPAGWQERWRFMRCDLDAVRRGWGREAPPTWGASPRAVGTTA